MKHISIRFLKIVVGYLVAFVMISIQAMANDHKREDHQRFVMDEVVVTADRDQQDVKHVPAQITVITKEDIKKSTAKNVVDLLSSEGGLVKRGFLGNDKKAAIDIRGMGETSVSSVLVLVDGMRINPPDMAGPDFSTIALDQIERVEIVHGAGTVLYGNGAVGGVVNIITRSPGGDTRANVKFETGSYGAYQGTATAAGTIDKFRLTALGHMSTTDGYRENGQFDNRNFDAKAAVDLNDWLTVNGTIQVHLDTYGFPGPLTYTQFKQDPRQSMDPTGSNGETRKEIYSGGLDADFEERGALSVKYTYGERDNQWRQLNTPGEINERSQELNLKHKWIKPWGSHLNELTAGFDYRLTDYFQDTSFAVKPFQQDTYGLYFFDKVTFYDKWILQAGARYHFYDTEMTHTGEEQNFNSTDTTVGLISLFSHKNQINGSVFVNYATSFRIPDIDELGFATADLKPQSGIHWDAGIKLGYKKWAELNVTGFYLRIEDEIWFDSMNYINTNYEQPTRRQGVEVAVRIYPLEQLRLWGHYSYTDATFEGTDFNVPTVPKHKFSSGLNWALRPWLDWAVTFNYVGERSQGGDIAGSDYKPMPAYQTADTKLTVDIASYGGEIYVAVNNIFDESYYSLSFYDNVYPSPGRNFRIGLEWTF